MRDWLLVAAVLVAPSPVFAGWGGAEWDMSREEVAAFRGEKPSARHEDYDQYQGQVAGLDVRLNYSFTDEGLTMISISGNDTTRCHELANVVRDTYGEPFDVSDSDFLSFTRWSDEKNGNIVKLFLTKVDSKPIDCTVAYEPLQQPNAGGF